MTRNHDNCTVREVSEASFELEVLHMPGPTLVAFVAPWSKPCQVVHAVLNEVAAHCSDCCRVLQVNVDDSPDLGVWYDIESVPTLLCFVGGEVRARIVGTASKEAILAKLQPFIANP